MNWKKVGKHLLFPHPVITALMTLLAAAGLIRSLLRPERPDALSIAAYALSFYALVLVCLRVPDLVALIRRFRRENPWYLRYRDDLQLRMRLSLTCALCWNAAYALLQLALGLTYRSAWFFAMAGYYTVLAALRCLLSRQVWEHVPGDRRTAEWRVYRLCGAGLLMMNLALLVFLLCFVYRLRQVRHHEIVTIAMAVYTFTSTAVAVSGVIRYRRYESPVCSAAKAISLASALVSMLSLENTMLATFSAGEHPLFRPILLGCSGAAISLCILSMAVYMLVHATKSLKENASNRKEGSPS